MNDFIADMQPRLEQLNRLEEQSEESRKRGNGSPGDKALIESLRANISPTVLVHHDRLRSRGRRSVAVVKHGVCSGCHMGLPIGTAAAIRHQTELLECNNCGRYIFLAEDELAPASPPGPATKSSEPKRAAKKLNEVR
jgi:hypothetical protein